MLSLSRKQVLDRWDFLAPVLREGLYSEANADFVEKICADEHLPEETGERVAENAGYVLMGFLHPQDLAEELVSALALNPQVAKSLGDKINERIFVPLKEEIEKAYSPISKFEVAKTAAKVAPTGPSPKMVFDMVSGSETKATLKPINSVAPKPPAPPASAPLTASVSQKPISAVLSSIPAATPAPKPVAPMPAPLRPSTPAPAPIAPPVTKIPPASESKFAPTPFSQAGWSKTTSAPVQSASSLSQPVRPSSPSSEPAPIMLHEDAKFSSSDKTTDFHLERPGAGAEVSLTGVKSQQVAKPAVLELGSLANAPAKPEATAPKFTHYTDFQASAQPVEGRHVTEITGAPVRVAPAAPAPTMPPAYQMPPVPTPPKPPAPNATAMPTMPPPPRPPMPPAPPQVQRPSQPQPQPQPQAPQVQQPQGKVIKVNYP